MNKSVLISIQPKWCEKILNKEKIIEVRKTRPKIETPFKCYIYCTKASENEYYDFKLNCSLNGKVIGKFVCDAIYPIWVFESGSIQNWNYFSLDESCLSLDEMANYIGRNKTGYGWHISDLKIYEEPKELSEFCKPCKHDCRNCKYYSFLCLAYDYDSSHCDWRYIESIDSIIKRPPQSWCYVEEI